MPLPEALQARLLKRGILQAAQKDNEEEIIAESYDDHEDENDYGPPIKRVAPTKKVVLNSIVGAESCPNKWNVFHECTAQCVKRWGDGVERPTKENEIRRLFMLKKYPLPEDWLEVYDKGTGRFYYWSTTTDEVCWLSPSHPKAKIGVCAAKLRSDLKNKKPEISKKAEREDGDDSEEEEVVGLKQVRLKRDKERSERRNFQKGKSKKVDNDLDPMDPAAYSDVPRGGWSEGLEIRNEASTGVDTTASGPLFQMRPYPNPGAVLRANAASKK